MGARSPYSPISRLVRDAARPALRTTRSDSDRALTGTTDPVANPVACREGAQAQRRLGLWKDVSEGRSPGAIHVDNRRGWRPVPVVQPFECFAASAGGRASESSRSTRAGYRIAAAIRARSRALIHASGSLRSPRDGSVCSTRTRHPCRRALWLERRILGTLPGSGASRLGPSRRSGHTVRLDRGRRASQPARDLRGRQSLVIAIVTRHQKSIRDAGSGLHCVRCDSGRPDPRVADPLVWAGVVGCGGEMFRA